MKTNRAHLHPNRMTALAVLATLAASCGGDPGSTSEGDATSDDGVARPAAEASDSPLAEFLSTGSDEPTLGQPSGARRDDARYQDLIVECMADQGFSYIPTSDDGSLASGRTDGPWSLPEDEFVAAYGYGITTVPSRRQPSDDPNEEQVEAMSTAERSAYFTALWGNAVPLDDDGYPAQGDRPSPASTTEPTEQGCSGSASDRVWGEANDDTEALAEFQPLIDDVQQLWHRVETDPRVRDAAATWSACMAAAGHPGFEQPDGPAQEVSRRLDDLIAEADIALDTDSAARGLRPVATLDEVNPSALAELRAYELAVARADHRCAAAYEDAYQQVQSEVEQAFVDEHRGRLEAYRDALASRGGND